VLLITTRHRDIITHYHKHAISFFIQFLTPFVEVYDGAMYTLHNPSKVCGLAACGPSEVHLAFPCGTWIFNEYLTGRCAFSRQNVKTQEMRPPPRRLQWSKTSLNCSQVSTIQACVSWLFLSYLRTIAIFFLFCNLELVFSGVSARGGGSVQSRGAAGSDRGKEIQVKVRAS